MIVGFDNLSVSSHVTTALTTVSYQCFNIASKAYSIMLDYVNNCDHKTGVYEVPFALTIRETTKKVRMIAEKRKQTQKKCIFL